MTGPDDGLLAPRLVGVWALQAYTDEARDGTALGEPFGPNPHGLLLYTEDGFVSAQLMKPGRAPFGSLDWQHGRSPNTPAPPEGTSAIAGATRWTKRTAR